MTNQIEDVIQGLDKNINFLEKTEKGVSEIDVKGLLIDIIGTIRDMWEKFNNVFEMVDKLKEIEDSAKKGEKNREKDIDKDQDLRSLYL